MADMRENYPHVAQLVDQVREQFPGAKILSVTDRASGRRWGEAEQSGWVTCVLDPYAWEKTAKDPKLGKPCFTSTERRK